jgi:exodeoxyribonuclease VII small subunit
VTEKPRPLAGAPAPSEENSTVTFEQALERLETIVHELEDGQLGLDESLGRYEEGIRLLRQCTGLLERAERRIQCVSGLDADGNPITQPFDDRATPAQEEKGPSRSRQRSTRGPSTPADEG